MNIFWKKYKEYVILIAILIVLGILSVFVANYLIKGMSVKNDSIQKEVIDHEEREKRLEEISVLERQFETIEKEKGKLEVFVSRDQMIALIKELEKTAEETNNEITIDEVEVQDKNSKKELKNKSVIGSTSEKKKEFNFLSDNYIKIKISLKGSYNDTVNFIRKIENINYCSDIVSFQSLVEKNELVGQSPGSYSKKSSLLAGKSFLAENNSSEIATKENTEETLISSVLGIVFYLNE